MESLIGALMAGLLVLIALPTWEHFQSVGLENTRTIAAARQLKEVSDAAEAYIKQNYTAIEGVATASSPATISVGMLQSTGFLSSSFVNTNPWAQTYSVQVLQPSTGILQALVLTSGGSLIPQATAPLIASQAGAEGGLIPYPNQYGSLQPTVAEGAYGGWQVSMSSYTNPGQGHLAALLSFNNGTLQNDYLNRTAVPGQPQLNTMQTNLNMGSNNINSVNNVQSNSAQFAGGSQNGMPGSVQIGSQYLYGDTSNFAIRTPGGIYIQNQAGTAAANINQVGNIYANGTLQGSDLYPTLTAAAGTGCTPNGLIAHDSTGAELSCVNGVWKGAGGGITTGGGTAQLWKAISGQTITCQGTETWYTVNRYGTQYAHPVYFYAYATVDSNGTHYVRLTEYDPTYGYSYDTGYIAGNSLVAPSGWNDDFTNEHVAVTLAGVNLTGTDRTQENYQNSQWIFSEDTPAICQAHWN